MQNAAESAQNSDKQRASSSYLYRPIEGLHTEITDTTYPAHPMIIHSGQLSAPNNKTQQLWVH